MTRNQNRVLLELPVPVPVLVLLLLLLSTAPHTAGALPQHPRLRLLPPDIPPLVRTIQSDATARAIYANLRTFGNQILTEPPVNDTRNGPEKVLTLTARVVIDRVYTLALLYRLGIDDDAAARQRWLDRAALEMRTVARFPDWNPVHFLDVAEFTHALAVGYDWLYADLSAADRRTIEQGLLINGLAAGLRAYASGAWWAADDYNWNLVCNGGLSAGAFALYDVYPAEARQVVGNATLGVPSALRSYAYDGAWPEGPGYWDYATHYAEALLDVYETAQGTDNGWSRQPGLDATGLFPIYTTGPSGAVFNWADSEAPGGLTFAAPATMWLGKHFPMRAVYGYLARAEANATTTCSGWARCAMELMDFTPVGSASDLLGLPTDALFFDKALGVFRTGWAFGPGRSADSWVAFKGCNGSANHGDLDAGGFVWETEGYRWAHDLGADSYGLPGYFTKDNLPGHRFSYYRKATRGHNTLVFDEDPANPLPSNQAIAAFSNVTLFHPSSSRSGGGVNEGPGNWSYAILTLTPAYEHQGAKRVQRGIAMPAEGGVLLVVDEMEFPAARNVTWSAHTFANVTTAGNVATLLAAAAGANGTTTITHTVTVQEPKGAVWDVQPIRLPPPQEPTNGLSKLRLVLGPAVPPRVVVVFGTTSGQMVVNPLAEWGAKGPVAAQQKEQRNDDDVH